jgi:hypothetical protein
VTGTPVLLKRLNAVGTVVTVIRALPVNCSVVIGEGDEDKIVPEPPERILIPKTTEVSVCAPSVFTHHEI